MNAKGGKREGAGRKKGSQNKITMEIKDAIKAAFEEVGGVAYLVEQARENPAVFCGLIGKILPKDIKTEITVKSHEEALRELL